MYFFLTRYGFLTAIQDNRSTKLLHIFQFYDDSIDFLPSKLNTKVPPSNVGYSIMWHSIASDEKWKLHLTIEKKRRKLVISLCTLSEIYSFRNLNLIWNTVRILFFQSLKCFTIFFKPYLSTILWFVCVPHFPSKSFYLGRSLFI